MQCKAGGTSCHSHQLGLSGPGHWSPQPGRLVCWPRVCCALLGHGLASTCCLVVVLFSFCGKHIFCVPIFPVFMSQRSIDVCSTKSPQYTTDCCIHSSDIARRQHLRSAGCHQLFVPRHRRSMFGRRAFSVAGPAACNSLADYMRDPSRSFDSFRRDLKTFLFWFY